MSSCWPSQPHAHYRAKRDRGTATLPDGTVAARHAHPGLGLPLAARLSRGRRRCALPKGTRLSMEYTYDNSAANVRNPQLPPIRVFWGQRSKDEMGDLWFQLLPRTTAIANG